jgi:hypothetical protein
MPKMNYLAIYFLMEKINGLSPQRSGPDPRVRSTRTRCTGALQPSVYGSVAGILWIEGVCGDLITIIHSRTNGQDGAATHGGDWRDTCSGARGNSPELSLALAPVAHPPLGLHLCDLLRMGVLTDVFTGIGEVKRGLAVRKRAQGESTRSRALCSAPSASVPLLATVTMSPLPQQPVKRGRGAMKWRDGGGV